MHFLWSAPGKVKPVWTPFFARTAMHPPESATIVSGLGNRGLAIFAFRWRHPAVSQLRIITMRTLLFVCLLTLAAAPAFAQGMGTGTAIPLNQEKKVSPEEEAKRRATEEAYKSTLKTIPEAKANDPWGNMRSVEPSPGSPKAKSAPKKSN
jgi:hypothetical protein